MQDYTGFGIEVLGHPQRGPEHADVLVDVCQNICQSPRLQQLTGGDGRNINGVIDAQLDRLIVASEGDVRLALFATLAALGRALQALHGG
jgi:hypothetical protein